MASKYLSEPSTPRLSESVHFSPSDSSVEIKPIAEAAALLDIIGDLQGPAKFHIGMLSISFIAGLAYSLYVAYNCWREKNVFLSHIRNLVIALTCRTFFSILFEGVIILGSPTDVDGGNTLLSFECISLNLVMAFWLTFTIYIHARVQRNFNSEPTMKLYIFGVPGVSVYFALVWIFAMEGTHSSQLWWLIYYLVPFYQWLVNSLRLFYLLVQLALLIDTGRMMMVKSTDNDTVSLMRKVALMMGALVLLFWLQFGLSVGRPSLANPEPYLYFYYLIDGTQCVLVCIVLFFFNMWVPMILDNLPNVVMESGEMAGRTSTTNDEVLIRRDTDKGIVTIDSLFKEEESGKWATAAGRGDVVYSSVVQPQNLHKTIDLYKRLNIIPADKVTIIQGEEFYDCALPIEQERSDPSLESQFRDSESTKTLKVETKTSEKLVKKNAFYSSKYLILDTKEKDIPRYLETRGRSVSEGRETLKEEVRSDLSTSLESLRADDLVKKWLADSTNSMRDGEQLRQSFQKASFKRNKERRASVSESIISTVNSVILGTLFRSKREDSLNVESNPEFLNSKNDSNSDTLKARSRENSHPTESEIHKSDNQPKIGPNNKEEVLDLRLAEPQSIEGDGIKIAERNERPVEGEKERERNETVHYADKQNLLESQPDRVQDKVKDEDTGVAEDSDSEAIYKNCSKSANDRNPSEQEKTISMPGEDFLKDTDQRDHLKGESESLENISEAEADTEKLPGKCEERNLFVSTRNPDLKTAKNVQESPNPQNGTAENVKSKGLEDSEAPFDRCLTYSELLKYRSQREQREKETADGKDQE